MIKNSIEIKNNINNTSANMLKTVQRRGKCINYWPNALQHLTWQESLANAKEARDSSECMKTPSEEIYSKFAIDG